MNKHLVIIYGPTGIGKTDLSISIAEKLESEIFSCDSRQIYKELNIAVAKPNSEQLDKIKHHFIGEISINDHYSISKYEDQAIKRLNEYFQKNKVAVMCGGSGLYIDAICKGVDQMPDHDQEIRKDVIKLYNEGGIEALRFELKRVDPDFHKQVDLNNPQRIQRAIEIYRSTGIAYSKFRTNKTVKRDFNIIKIGLDIDRDKLYDRINKRVDIMIADGLVEEAKGLFKHRDLVALKTIGYRELFDYFDNKTSLETAIELVKRNTRHYARRQLTWFRRYKDTEWFNTNISTSNEILNLLTYKYIK